MHLRLTELPTLRPSGSTRVACAVPMAACTAHGDRPAVDQHDATAITPTTPPRVTLREIPFENQQSSATLPLKIVYLLPGRAALAPFATSSAAAGSSVSTFQMSALHRSRSTAVAPAHKTNVLSLVSRTTRNRQLANAIADREFWTFHLTPLCSEGLRPSFRREACVVRSRQSTEGIRAASFRTQATSHGESLRPRAVQDAS